jgi:hypothetical protein
MRAHFTAGTMVSWPGVKEGQVKQVFFEKKNQKTFALEVGADPAST